ncbi:MAG: HEPN domain-containing protein [Elainellaceae cyanobacterium]
MTQTPNYDAVFFHAQQCIEKYLKACLQEANIAFSKTHDLASLLDLLLPTIPDWASLRPTLDALTVYAVEFRYPGMAATQEIAQDALQDCIRIRQVLRTHLELS